MQIVMALVDERLIHGQVLNQWIVATSPNQLIIVDNELVEDRFMSNIYKALSPLWLDVQIYTVDDAAKYLLNHVSCKKRIFLIAKSPESFAALIKAKTPIKRITLADRMYLPNKLKIPTERKEAIKVLFSMGVSIVAQQNPDQEPCKFTSAVIDGQIS